MDSQEPVRCLIPTAAALRTMESSVWTRALACALLLSLVCGAEVHDSNEEVDLDTRALRDFYPKDPNLTNEKELVSPTREPLARVCSEGARAFPCVCARARLLVCFVLLYASRPHSLELSKKFWKSCRANASRFGKRSLDAFPRWVQAPDQGLQKS